MNVCIEHSVMFHLGDHGPVVPRRGTKGYVRVDGVTVDFPASGDPRVWAGGIVCRKDGSLSPHWGRTSTSADLPDNGEWIQRAIDALKAEAGEPVK